MGEAKKRGTYEARKSAAQGMMDLAVAITGREVDMDLVQITDQKAFGRLHVALMEVTSHFLRANRGKEYDEQALERALDTPAYIQEDGRLIIHIPLPTGGKRIVEVARGDWRELSAQQHKELLLDVEERQRQDPEGVANLIGKIGEWIASGAAAIESQGSEMGKALSSSSQVLQVFDKTQASLLALNETIKHYPGMRVYADKWLASDELFLVGSVGPTPRECWAATVPDKSALLEEGLFQIAGNITKIATTLLFCDWLEDGLCKRIEVRWAELGGKVLSHSSSAQ